MTDPEEIDPYRGAVIFSAERLKAFTDAVVAIAMTLLILPLLESISDAASEGGGAEHWLDDHAQQAISFVLSFAIIALFWVNHHRLFAGVERTTSPLIWLTLLWMLTIVWLPVPTAMSGQMSTRDALVKIMYVGSMILTQVASLFVRLYLRRHPQLHDIPHQALVRGIAVDIAIGLTFAVALAVMVIFPDLGYWPMLLMILGGRVQELLARMLGVGLPRRSRR